MITHAAQLLSAIGERDAAIEPEGAEAIQWLAGLMLDAKGQITSALNAGLAELDRLRAPGAA